MSTSLITTTKRVDNNVEFLEEYSFPVESREVFYSNATKDGVDKFSKYQTIIRTDTEEPISIMSSKYKIVPNIDVIEPLIKQLEMFDNSWYIDPSHSFCKNNRMKIQVTFPELKLNDGDSDIALSLFVNNSYDGTEGVRMNWGAIRAICTNGMVFGTLISKAYGKHYESFKLETLFKEIEKSYSLIPMIKERIEQLQYLEVTADIIQKIQASVGKKYYEYIEAQRIMIQDEDRTKYNQWALYNLMTWYVSHNITQQSVEYNQKIISNIFKF